MANQIPKRASKEWDKVSVNSAVQWCCYLIVLALCGYGLYRQHRLEQRLSLLEEKHRGLRRTVLEMEPMEKVKENDIVKREKRDVNDCVCPPGREFSANH
ncbi:unnamed protein product [Parnassius apollo]|uniref:(apollo) hypothetical protein n=1 Tax=Parnassius apollo TaxID=110799 RepID=A0A8S3WLH2_PARAO|nr:unnamed protein product [Parnassius apollo]